MLTPRLWERLARVRAMGGCTPGNSRLWSWSPVGTVQDRPRRQPRRRLTPRLWERSARVRAMGFGGARRLEFRLSFTETSQNWGKL